jgi:hypothetical protein
MKNPWWLPVVLLAAAASLTLSACGGGSSGGPPPPPVTYRLTVNSSDPSSGVPIAATPTDNNGATGGNTSYTLTYNAGSAVTLSANAFSGSNSFSSWTGCTSSNNETCNITLNANATVIANYSTPVKSTPTVTVTPAATSISVGQPLQVTVAVGGSPTPTGSVILSSGNYISVAFTLSNGSASITIPAGSLAVGTDTLSAAYTPDSSSSSIYNDATGTAAVGVSSTSYVLTVNSVAPSSGVSITVSPADNNGAGNGTTGFTRTYNAGTTVSLAAPISSGSYSFVSWSGCTSIPGSGQCSVTMNANTTVTATFNQAGVTSVVVSPSTATIGAQQQFTATVNGNGSFSKTVTWSLTCSLCGNLSEGSISAAGLYTTPYPAPASVTVTATSTQNTAISGSTTVTLNPPATTTGPALSVDAGNQTHAISPLIYGMNAYVLDNTTAATANISVARWGGDGTSRYNYKLNVSSAASDWYFENGTGSGGVWPDGNFNDFVTSGASDSIKTIGTVPVLGWVAKDSTSCSFPKSTYPSQYAFDPYSGACGDGESPSQANITGNDPTVTSTAEPPPAPPAPSAVNAAWADNTWAGGWVASLVGKSETGASGGVTIWDLDNEPAWWDAVHRDVHPVPSTYDEVTDGGIGTALAIKTADPTAQVSGPVVDYWWNYFYSKKDIENGWSTGPCYEPWSGPTDRAAHGGTAFIEYYLKQFAAAENTYGVRLLDYLDIHGYDAPQYPLNSNNGLGLTAAGDTDKQILRMNATRVYWDPTYIDPDTSNQPFPQPNYTTDSNYTSSCNVPAQAPEIVRMLKTWVANDYPGTKTAIDEYNFGGMEAINGAVTQADILGIFGREGLDLATLWPTTNYSQQVPGTMAFAIYRNYDGNKSTFGDTALASTSTTSSNADGEGQLAVYGAYRSSDKAITVIVINKTYGALTSTVSLANFRSSSGTAQAYLYSNANLNAIVSEPAVTITPPASGSTTSTITTSFPAQSITLLVLPN